MRNLLTVVALLLVVAAVAGWYFGWYSVERTPTDGHEKIEIDVNKEKAKTDIRRGEDEVKDTWDKATGRMKSAVTSKASTGR